MFASAEYTAASNIAHLRELVFITTSATLLIGFDRSATALT